ncbi:MAG: tetratricopeptide repeat protein [Bacteroidetes bacterium]|nr:tetratricopeptide repeat protein [Bacteroidota bacterium]MBU1718926.1 tetratricopeptide repeat protein [Bacteroidota bacterium]
MQKIIVFFLVSLLFLPLLSSGYGISKEFKDSISIVLGKMPDNQDKADYLSRLCYDLRHADPQASRYYGQLSYGLCQKLEYKAGEANALVKIGNSYLQEDKYDSAIFYLTNAQEIYFQLHDTDGVGTTYTNLGNVYYNMGRFGEALNYHLSSLKISELNNDKDAMAYSYLNLGNLYDMMKMPERSLECYQITLALAKETRDIWMCGNAYGNIGIIYDDMGLKDTALQYYNLALQMKTEINDQVGIGIQLNNIGALYLETNRLEEAKEYFLKSKANKEARGDQSGLSTCYINLGLVEQDMGNLQAAEQYFLKSLNIAENIGSPDRISSAHQDLARNYGMMKKYQEAYLHFEQFFTIYDSLISEDNSQMVAEMQTKYESEKSEQEIVMLNQKNEINELEIKRQDEQVRMQQRQIIGFIAGLAVVCMLSLVLFRMYRQKRSMNIALEEQKKEILEKNEELQQQKEEIMAQRDEIEHAHDIIELKNRNITDSIVYAKRIQEAILPSEARLKAIFPEHFVFFKPKDIVSGDFYWVDEVETPQGEHVAVFSAIDCTGHGVPGAFMSIMANNLLEKAVKETGLISPAEILHSMSDGLHQRLRIRNDEKAVKDGMDIALCAFNKEQRILQYAGVHNPMYLLRNKEIIQYKPDTHPIGELVESDFSGYQNQQVQIEPGDTVFVFSDGFVDQMGGEKRKKYLSRRFRERLVQSADLNLEKMKEALMADFSKWRGDVEQYDDVLVFAVRF